MSRAIYKSSAWYCRHSSLSTLLVVILLMCSLCFLFAQLGTHSPLPAARGGGRSFRLDLSEYVSDDGEVDPVLSSCLSLKMTILKMFAGPKMTLWKQSYKPQLWYCREKVLEVDLRFIFSFLFLFPIILHVFVALCSQLRKKSLSLNLKCRNVAME